MSAFLEERVLSVHHWTDRLFSFTTTRDPALRFSNGHFTMIGLKVDGKPLLRAYSIASPNWEEHLEFFSIKVPDGPLTSRLQHLQPGDPIVVSKKPTGTLVLHDLLPGRNLYLFSTGTGLAPFMSVIQDPETYERFEKVVLLHGVRYVSELAYSEFIEEALTYERSKKRKPSCVLRIVLVAALISVLLFTSALAFSPRSCCSFFSVSRELFCADISGSAARKIRRSPSRWSSSTRCGPVPPRRRCRNRYGSYKQRSTAYKQHFRRYFILLYGCP